MALEAFEYLNFEWLLPSAVRERRLRQAEKEYAEASQAFCAAVTPLYRDMNKKEETTRRGIFKKRNGNRREEHIYARADQYILDPEKGNLTVIYNKVIYDGSPEYTGRQKAYCVRVSFYDDPAQISPIEMWDNSQVDSNIVHSDPDLVMHRPVNDFYPNNPFGALRKQIEILKAITKRITLVSSDITKTSSI